MGRKILDFSIFVNVAAVVAVSLTIGILTVASCTMLNAVLKDAFARVAEDHDGPQAEFLLENDEAQTLRNRLADVSNMVKKSANLALIVYMLPVFIILGYVIFSGYDLSKNGWYVFIGGHIVLKKVAQLLTFFSLGAVAFYTWFIINRVVGIKVLFAEAVMRNPNE